MAACLARRHGLAASAGARFAAAAEPALPGLIRLEAGDGRQAPPAELLLGTVRMGYGHYRMAYSAATWALKLGRTPLWHDLAGLGVPESRAVVEIDQAYSRASRLAAGWRPLEAIWERLTGSAGWGALEMGLALAQRLTGLAGELDRRLPLVSSYALAAQVGLAAGFERVVQMIPDNTPLPFHLAPGALHLVQTESLYQGYRALGVPPSALRLAGGYVDAEAVENLEADSRARIERCRGRRPLRVLLHLGGAGAQVGLLRGVIAHLSERARGGELTLLVHAGDHAAAHESFKDEVSHRGVSGRELLTWSETEAFCREFGAGGGGAAAGGGRPAGAYLFHLSRSFEAVAAGNRLMRCADLLVTKPSELAFFPLPILCLRRVGRHEALGAAHAAEMGTATAECRTPAAVFAALDRLLAPGGELARLAENVVRQGRLGRYDGARQAVESALEMAG